MLGKLTSKLSYANVMATIAVFLALGGVGVAAKALKKNSVGPKQLKNAAVTKEKIADGAVVDSKIAGGAVKGAKLADGSVNGAKLADGSVSLAKTDNSVHQKCQGGTVYILGSCVDQASQDPTTGQNYNNAEAACAIRSGGRLASAAELSSLVRGGFGTIPSPLFSWALEATGGGEAEIVSNIGAVGSAAGGTLHDYRCAFNPLG